MTQDMNRDAVIVLLVALPLISFFIGAVVGGCIILKAVKDGMLRL